MKLLIKVGGTLVDDPESRAAIAGEISSVIRAGHSPVVVHGGGRQLTRYLEAAGVESRFVNGLRVSTDQTIEAVLKILCGTVNKQLAGALRAAGLSAVGISGIDGRLTTVVQMSEDLEQVGRITFVDPTLLNQLASAGHIPVVACVAGDDDGRAWNINADQMAVACAAAFEAECLIFLTDVAGVLNGDGSVIDTLDVTGARELIAAGVARGGMQAKLEAACAAVAGGVGSVVVGPGHEAGIVARLLAGESCGTKLTAHREQPFLCGAKRT